MKRNKINILLIGLFFLSIFHFSFGQELFNSEDYWSSEFIGESINGVRVGKWIEIDSNKIVYGEYYYDSLGNPINTWLINMPNGLKRFETEYLEKKIIRTSIYRNNYIIAEILPNKYLSQETYSFIRAYEDSVFYLPVRTLTSNLYGRNPQTVGVFVYDYFEIFMRLSGRLIRKKFIGSVIGYNIDGTKRRKYNIKEGNIYKSSYFYSSSGKKLRQEIEYKNDSLVKTIYYNGKGEIKKIKK